MDTEERRPAETGARILVIDDEEVVHVSLRRILGRRGHEVDAVASAPEGLAKMADTPYDLVITDLMMPEMNGIELLERMEAGGVALPVLMITGYPTITTAIQALRLGAVDYLAKPFTRQELLGPVNRTLRRAGAHAEPDGAALVAPPDGDGLETPDLGLLPGARFHLRDHTWVVYQEDGTVEVGIEASFLETVGTIATIEIPGEADLLEQGYVGFPLKTVAGEEHAAFVPLSGQVVAVNGAAAGAPAGVMPDTWLVRLIPIRLEVELSLLVRG